ncbi:TPA: hypothetical protein N0F65_013024 [Lagenidium giganteum]|uniref:DDHD domain-containing protein n=1 Tax=Lagenidium giganteum TaxID=4803 RepID=A0AAV2YN98_9STRA|nr:TPA: hypothetical protein N0F65_013024 [Lagenidium giganteum]
MYHVAEIVRDAKRDMHERYESSTWAAYTPFPFLYALSGQISKTMQRKAPNLVKRAVVLTRDQMADAIATGQATLQEVRVAATHGGQQVFYQIKLHVETAPLPGAIAPIRSHVAVPFLSAVEGFAQFVTSEELPELYFVAKNRLASNAFLRHLVLPPLGAMEGIVRYVVIFPSQCVFPSREELESRTDLFLDVSTTRVQSFVEYLYSATEVLDQHWSMVQWNILGRGPYESLSLERRAEVIKSIQQRMRIIHSKFKLFEFMASVKIQNEMLYSDVLKECPHSGGIPLTEDEIAGSAALVKELEEQNQNSFPCWFYKKLDATGGKGKWVEFPAHENRRLERRYRFYERQKTLKRSPLPSHIVLVDEGRHEVNIATMEMAPVYWPALEKQVVCRSIWLYAQRNYGLAPYNASTAAVLESAFMYYLAHYDEEKRRALDAELLKQRGSRRLMHAAATTTAPGMAAVKCPLSVPVEGHLVEFKGPNDIMQYKRLLAGTTPFVSKRRVYRGDPRIKSDGKLMDVWKGAMLDDPCEPNADDADIEDEVDHLVLIVHGMGDALKTIDIINVVTLRSIIDCAGSLRDLHKEALRSQHFEHLKGRKPRVEFLPIEWHSKLHMEGLDNGIRDVTLPAIHKLREFANDTVLDVLFFMSPTFHQVILEQVAQEMNRVFELFQSRNKGWTGERAAHRKKVSIIAHSLGAIISFDILSHQTQTPKKMDEEGLDFENANGLEAMFVEKMKERSRSESDKHTWDRMQRNMATNNERKRPSSDVPRLAFRVENLFCLGSPVGLFLKVRGQKLQRDFCLPTCLRLFNIYHPYDPVAYRIEPILNQRRAHSKAAIIHTFEGKLRFQYQLRNSFRVMWQKLRHWRREFEFQVEKAVRSIGLVENISVHTSHPSGVAGLSALYSPDGPYSTRSARRRRSPTSTSLTTTAAAAVNVHAAREGAPDEARREMARHEQVGENEDDETGGTECYGRLCQGQPIDYTLQENEIEVTNEYLFALTAHVIYWTNRDASLFIAQKLILDPPAQMEREEDDDAFWFFRNHRPSQPRAFWNPGPVDGERTDSTAVSDEQTADLDGSQDSEAIAFAFSSSSEDT